MTEDKKTTETTTKTEPKSPDAFRQDLHELTNPAAPETHETRETHEKMTTTKTGE